MGSRPPGRRRPLLDHGPRGKRSDSAYPLDRRRPMSALRRAALAVRLVGVVTPIDVADVVAVAAMLSRLVQLASVLGRGAAGGLMDRGERSAYTDREREH